MTEEKKLPLELEPPVIEGGALSVRLAIPEDLFWFQGHFPVFPIVPGVALLSWVVHYAGRLVPGAALCEAEQIKFMKPLRPGERMQLRLSVEEVPGGKRMRFEFALPADLGGALCSKGKVLLCQKKN